VSKFLQELAYAGSPYIGQANLVGMDTDFMSSFDEMAHDYFSQTGKELKIGDAWRSYETQAEAYRNKPNLAAPPGTSRHETGMAMDLDTDQANELANMGLLEKYGFHRPMLGQGKSGKNEPWHIERRDLNKEMTVRAGAAKPDFMSELNSIGSSVITKDFSQELAGIDAQSLQAPPEPSLSDPTSESLSMFSEGAGPAAKIAGGIANAPFVPLEWLMKTASQKTIRPLLDLSFPKATEEEKEMVTGGAALVGSLAAAPGYLRLLGKVPSIVGEWAGSKLAPHLYESALKIPPSVPADIRNRVVQTGIEGAYLPNKASLARLEKEGARIGADIDKMIDEGAKAGKVIDFEKAASRLEDLKDYYRGMPDPTGYLQKIDEAKAGILQYRGQTIPVDVAQTMKKRLYQVQKDAYGEMTNLSREFDKTLARGLKEELEKQFPELQRLNKDWADKINLNEVLERSVHRIRNYEVIRLGDIVAGGVGGAAQGTVEGAGLMFLVKRVLDSPIVKARLAIGLDRAHRLTRSNIAGKPLNLPEEP
jgi:hypothetical protein